MAVVRVNEGIDITKLHLDRRAHAVVANHLREIVNDPLPTLKASPMVVGHLQDEQLVKNISIDAHVIPPRTTFMARKA
jgi:hypothetical protein